MLEGVRPFVVATVAIRRKELRDQVTATPSESRRRRSHLRARTAACVSDQLLDVLRLAFFGISASPGTEYHSR
jgi:hypothetical protein